MKKIKQLTKKSMIEFLVNILTNNRIRFEQYIIKKVNKDGSDFEPEFFTIDSEGKQHFTYPYGYRVIIDFKSPLKKLGDN